MKQQQPFTAFGQLVVERALAKGISLPEEAHKCSIHLITLRRGLQDAHGPRNPRVVRQLCEDLEIDYLEAYLLLGWIPATYPVKDNAPAH